MIWPVDSVLHSAQSLVVVVCADHETLIYREKILPEISDIMRVVVST